MRSARPIGRIAIFSFILLELSCSSALEVLAVRREQELTWLKFCAYSKLTYAGGRGGKYELNIIGNTHGCLSALARFHSLHFALMRNGTAWRADMSGDSAITLSLPHP